MELYGGVDIICFLCHVACVTTHCTAFVVPYFTYVVFIFVYYGTPYVEVEVDVPMWNELLGVCMQIFKHA